jgi:tetratricopeptide (TPR) repeat protein
MFAGVPKAALEAYQKAAAAAQKNDSKAAMQFLIEAVAAKPDFAPALSDLGTLYEKEFQWSKAAETFAALVKVTPKDPSAQTSLGIALYHEGDDLMSQKKYEDAEKLFNVCEAAFRESIKLRSPAPVPHYYIGLIAIKFKAYDDAQRELEASIKDGGDNMPLAHKMLGGVYISTKKNKEAADELEKYLKLDPKAADAEKIKKTISDLRKQ